MAAKVLISGASVGGPALAYWLDHYGFETTVVEVESQGWAGGYAVGFRGSTHLSVLKRMGVLEELQAHSLGGSPTRFVEESGRSLLYLPPGITGVDMEIARADLSRVLYGRSCDTVEYLFRDTITHLEQSSDGVQVTFEKAPARRFDLVIGADGMHSRVRRLAFGPAERFVRRLGYYLAAWDMLGEADLQGEVRVFNRAGTAIALAESVHDPDRVNVLGVFASGPRPGIWDDPWRQREVLEEVYGGQGWQVPAALAALPSATDMYVDAIARVDVPAWSSGRVALLGDAASGATFGGIGGATFGGVGAGTAIVAAYVLAGELAQAGDDHAVAFERYERIIRPMPFVVGKVRGRPQG